MVEDPLDLFPEGDQFFAGDSLAEPAVGLIPLEDLPSGVSLAEPAQAAPEAQHVEQPDQAQAASEALPASSGDRGRRPAVSSPLHILLPEDAIGGMGTLFADPSLGPAQAYSISAPGFRNQHVLFTYVHCNCPLLSALEQLQVHAAVNGTRGVVELHADGTHHLHKYVQKSKSLLTWTQVTIRYSGMSWRPHARVLSTAWHKYNTFVYLEKEGTTQQTGRFAPPLRPQKGGTGIPSGQQLLAIASCRSTWPRGGR